MDALDALTTSPPDDGTVQPPEGQGHAPVDTSAVQPDGQGQQDATAGFYDLSSITDPAIRSEVERIAKDIDRNVNAKFQDHATYRGGWEPYQAIQLGEGYDPINVQDYDPAGVGALLRFAEELTVGGDTARDALVGLAESLDIDLGIAPAEPANDDPVASLQARLDAFEAAQQAERDEAEMQRLRGEAESGYRAEYAEVEQANGKPFSEEEKARLIGLAKRFRADSDTPIKAAWEFINSIAGQAETALVAAQPKPPTATVPAGRASTAVKPVDTFEEAERLHRERNGSA